MGYFVKELIYTLQGEGHNTGRPAVFCRFTGCNLWTGREEDRSNAVCRFCDTDFVGTDGLGGGKFESAETLAQAAASTWPLKSLVYSKPLLVCTGGEPLLQLDNSLVIAFKEAGFEVAIETNGTLPMLPGIDWICVSPKGQSQLALTSGDELKFVYPQEDASPATYENLQFGYFYLQPMDGPNVQLNTDQAVKYCMEHPKWTLSLQTHKLLGIR